MKPLFSLFLRAVLLILIVSAVFAPAYSGQPVCDRCGHEIQGDFVSAQGLSFHPECFVCGYCKNPIKDRDYSYDHGRFYHVACYQRQYQLICSHCDRPITDTYIEVDKRKYHEQCYQAYVAPRCAACGERLTDMYQLDAYGNRYHPFHQDVFPSCRYCQGYFLGHGRGGQIYDDGRAICDHCLATAVTDEDELETLAEEINGHLTLYGLNVVLSQITLEFGNLDELQIDHANPHPNPTGLTRLEQRTAFFGLITESDQTVTIAYGMPRAWVISTLAHELTHVWHNQNGRLDLESAFCEGSCNYASYLVLQEYEGPLVDYLILSMEQEADPIYGDGYRMVKNWVDRASVYEWVALMLTADTLPRD